MGEVYQALDTRLNRRIAIKVLPSDAGWRDYAIAAIDPMLATVRDDPRFRTLVERARTDVAAQRERARQRGLLDFASLLGRPLE